MTNSVSVLSVTRVDEGDHVVPALNAARARFPRAASLLLVLTLLGAFALRLWNLDTQSLWHDEAWSVFSAYHPFAPMGIRGADVNAPFVFYGALGAWIRLVGDSVWAMRYWSLVIGLIIVALSGWIARRWFGPWTGVLAGLFTAVSPILWVFSQEIRAYIAMPLAALILLILLDSVLTKPSPRGWIALWAVELATLYVHNLSVPIVAWLNLTALPILLWGGLRERRWRPFLTWIGGQLMVLIAYLPWLLTQRQTGTPLNTPPTLSPLLLWDIWQSYFTGIKAMVGANIRLMILCAAFGVAALGGIALALIRFRSRRTWLVVSQVALLPVLQLAIILAAHIDFHPRYFILGVPATLILIAAGYAPEARLVPIKGFITNRAPCGRWFAINSHIPPNLRLGRARHNRTLAICGLIKSALSFASASAAILALLIMLQMANVLYSSPIYQHDDFRAIAERYARLGPDDAIIIPYGWEPTLDYYSQKMGFKAKFIEIPLHTDPTTVSVSLSTQLNGVRHVELLTWYQLPADVNGMYPCLLSTAARETMDKLTVSGFVTAAYVTTERQYNVAITPDAQSPTEFGPLTLRSSVLGGNGETYCLMTQWSLSRPTQDNWRVAAQINNPLGWELARQDSDIVSREQLPIRLWRIGDIGTAFTRFALPIGLPPANYPIKITVYGPQSISAFIGDARFDVPDTRTPPDEADKLVRQGLYLHTVEAPEDLGQGEQARVSLLWRHTLPAGGEPVRVRLVGDGWVVESQGTIPPQSPVLTWHSLRVPATASGSAKLTVSGEDGKVVVLREYDIPPIPRTMVEPAGAVNFRLPTPVEFSGVGQLLGVDVPHGAISPTGTPLIKLLWRGSSTPDVSFTVFVHLRDQDRNIIAQSDSQPVDGARPTTTWIAGEYLVDAHDLTWNRTDYRGAATIAIGLYDQATGKRVKLSDGSDETVLPITVAVNVN